MRHCNGLTGGMLGHDFFYHTFKIWRLKIYANHIEKSSDITINGILRNITPKERSCLLNYISSAVKYHGYSFSPYISRHIYTHDMPLL